MRQRGQLRVFELNENFGIRVSALVGSNIRYDIPERSFSERNLRRVIQFCGILICYVPKPRCYPATRPYFEPHTFARNDCRSLTFLCWTTAKFA